MQNHDDAAAVHYLTLYGATENRHRNESFNNEDKYMIHIGIKYVD